MQNLRAYALGDPAAFAAMMSAKVRRLWLTPSTGTRGARSVPVRALHLALVLLSAAGLVAGLAVVRDPVLVLVALVALAATAVNAVLVSEARHALTVIPLLAAGGMAGWALLLGARRGA